MYGRVPWSRATQITSNITDPGDLLDLPEAADLPGYIAPLHTAINLLFPPEWLVTTGARDSLSLHYVES
jgi:hypothetical protein